MTEFGPPPEEPQDPKELGTYFALAQVGLEMVLPIVAGLGLDHYLGWSPWGVVAGATLGLAGGITHLVALQNRRERNRTGSGKGTST